MTEPAPRPAEPLAVSLDNLAAMTGISLRGLYREARSGRLRARKIGRRTVVLIDDARAWLSAR